MGIRLGNSVKPGNTYDIVADPDKLYDLDEISDVRSRATEGPIALEYNPVAIDLISKVYYKISTIASSRALFRVLLYMNKDYNFPNPKEELFATEFKNYFDRYFPESYKYEYERLVEEVSSDTDVDGMLKYLKEKGLYITQSDVERYLLNTAPKFTPEYDDIINAICDLTFPIMFKDLNFTVSLPEEASDNE